MNVNIYADGACSGNPGIAGWTAIFVSTDSPAESLAVIAGLEAVEDYVDELEAAGIHDYEPEGEYHDPNPDDEASCFEVICSRCYKIITGAELERAVAHSDYITYCDECWDYEQSADILGAMAP